MGSRDALSRNLYRLWQVKLSVGLLLIRSDVLGNDASVSRNGCGLSQRLSLRNSQILTVEDVLIALIADNHRACDRYVVSGKET